MKIIISASNSNEEIFGKFFFYNLCHSKLPFHDINSAMICKYLIFIANFFSPFTLPNIFILILIYKICLFLSLLKLMGFNIENQREPRNIFMNHGRSPRFGLNWTQRIKKYILFIILIIFIIWMSFTFLCFHHTLFLYFVTWSSKVLPIEFRTLFIFMWIILQPSKYFSVSFSIDNVPGGDHPSSQYS